MPSCCRCSGKGRCIACACAKRGTPCTNCQPSKISNCENGSHKHCDDATASNSNAALPTELPLSQATEVSVGVASISQPTPPSTARRAAEDAATQSPLTLDPNYRPPAATLPPSPPQSILDPSLSVPPLPLFTPMNEPNFSWGELDARLVIRRIQTAYEKVVHWRRNVFLVPSGKVGRSFVDELARLFKSYGEASALEPVALSATTVLCALLLQKPSRTSKAHDHIQCLQRRLKTWRAGAIDDLVQEGKIIQSRLSTCRPTASTEQQVARAFAKLMFEGKTKAAIRLLSTQPNSSILPLNLSLGTGSDSETVLETLRGKHPEGQAVQLESIIQSPDPPCSHPVIFESIDANSIRTAALQTEGAAGPSGIDAKGWRRMCTAFKTASDNLCNSLALIARRLCSDYVDPRGISALMACRLVALDKNPGVRPIGICETARRIIAKAILRVIKTDVQKTAGSVQLCAGQIGGTEAAIHAVREMYKSDEIEAVLLVDARNAFNSLNRQTALRNIPTLCPSLAPILINSYRDKTNLYIDNSVLSSQEGTTQGDPLAMPMYAIAILPLIGQLHPQVKQAWYADDATAAGTLGSLRTWWEDLVSKGPAYGYFVNTAKTWLVTKEIHKSSATLTFQNTGVNITTEGKPHLGGALGTTEFAEGYIQQKIEAWTQELNKLVSIASTQPHAAYTAFTHGVASKWLYAMRTIPNIGHLLQPLEDIIRQKLIPSLTGRPPPNDRERELVALPVRLGGMGLINPTMIADQEYKASKEVTKSLTQCLIDQCQEYSDETEAEQRRAKREARKLKRQKHNSTATELRAILPAHLKYAMDLAQEKGASNWLSALPIEEFGFSLHKGAFRDAIALRYGWQPQNLPTSCSCSKPFSVDHALSCPKGGFPIQRHNEIRDLTGNLLTEVCHNVSTEPHLQPITGEPLTYATANVQDGARLDIAANGFWGGRFERAFFDVKVFNPYAPSNRLTQPSSSYRAHENSKKRMYEQRIREIEHSSFTPLVMSLTGGLGREAHAAYKRLASLLASKWDKPYSTTMSWLRCMLSFALLRASILCIRGTRSSAGRITNEFPPVDLVFQEAQLSTSSA